MQRRWRTFGILAALLATLTCGALTLAVGREFISPADVHPPYPQSELLTTQKIWLADGWHVIRVYHTPARQPDVIVWYYESGPPLPLHIFEIPCPGIHFYTQVPKLPFSFWMLRRGTFVHYCAEENGTQITADTYYVWEYIRP